MIRTLLGGAEFPERRPDGGIGEEPILFDIFREYRTYDARDVARAAIESTYSHN